MNDVPSLRELPPTRDGRTGWPWTLESHPSSAGDPTVRHSRNQASGETTDYTEYTESRPENKKSTDSGAEWPRITIVTPNYNGAEFLESAIRSVLLQGYPNLEYVVVDGGSTDGSVEIIRRYEPWLSRWSSESDSGQYDAVNKGFHGTSGHIMAWLNSDDMYVANALRMVGRCFVQCGEKLRWLAGISSAWNVDGEFCWVGVPKRYNRYFLRRGCYEGRGLGWIQQESVFWRRSLWDDAGAGLDTSLTLAADFELWTRFARHAELYAARNVFGAIRRHGRQRSADIEAYRDEIDACLGRLPDRGRLARAFRIPVVRTVLQLVARRARKAPIAECDPLTCQWGTHRR